MIARASVSNTDSVSSVMILFYQPAFWTGAASVFFVPLTVFSCLPSEPRVPEAVTGIRRSGYEDDRLHAVCLPKHSSSPEKETSCIWCLPFRHWITLFVSTHCQQPAMSVQQHIIHSDFRIFEVGFVCCFHANVLLLFHSFKETFVATNTDHMWILFTRIRMVDPRVIWSTKRSLVAWNKTWNNVSILSTLCLLFSHQLRELYDH